MTWLWVASLGLPPAAALGLLAGGAARAAAMHVAPWAAAPALVLGLADAAPPTVVLPWLLLGTELALDGTARVFVAFTALLWLLAGLYARAYVPDGPGARRFFVFFLLALTGNLGAVVARDVATFYCSFALMTFAAYGLVVHDGSPRARHAGRVYVVMAVGGETLFLSGLLVAVHHAGSLDLPTVAGALATARWGDIAVALLWAGLGVKAGALPLHAWLPLAHPVAPTPASAVLSGCMIKVGLLGWLRCLPLGAPGFADWGGFLVVMGLAAAVFGVVVGAAQIEPKTLLAYSSVSQMGIMTVGVGLGLLAPDAAPVALGAVAVYALHHGLAKGALFLGVGILDIVAGRSGSRWLVLAGLGLASLALAGAPLTSGAIAKSTLKQAATLAPPAWYGWLDWLLPLTAVGTTALIARFLAVAWDRSVEPHAAHPRERDGGAPAAHRLLWASWALVLGGVATAAWILPWRLDVAPGTPSAGPAWEALWPVLAGAALVMGAAYAARRHGIRVAGIIGPGDLAHRGERALSTLSRLATTSRPAARWHGAARDVLAWDPSAMAAPLGRAEHAIARWGIAGLLLLSLVVILLVLLWAG